jgi:hypothetical protein
MINNTNRRKQWLIDWDEYAIYRERAIYRAGAFVVMGPQPVGASFGLPAQGDGAAGAPV